MKNHPNALIGGSVGAAGGAIVAWLLNNVLGWGVPPEACAAIAGGFTFAVLYVGRRGLKATLKAIWNGTSAK